MSELWGTVPDWITASAAAWAAILGWRGLKTWQHELRGKTEYDLARRILVGIYRIQDAIERVRSGSIQMGNWAPVLQEEDAVKALEEAFERLMKTLQDATSPVRADLLEARAVWNDELVAPWQELEGVIRELRLGLRRYKRMHDPRNRQRYPDAQVEKTEDLIFQGADDPAQDKYLAKVLGAVERFEQVLRPRIQESRALRGRKRRSGNVHG